MTNDWLQNAYRNMGTVSTETKKDEGVDYYGPSNNWGRGETQMDWRDRYNASK